MSNTKVSGERDYAQLETEFTKLREDVASLADTVKSIAASEARGVSEALRSSFDSAANQARRASKRVQTGAHDAAESLQASVEEHPISSVLLALGVGVVVGMMLRR
jgi:ElaB/YqjD/DUF883 family membrane-anchored ribosome-binding protein